MSTPTHAFASTALSIDVSQGPVFIAGSTCIFVGKLVRFLSMLQWGRIVTYKGKPNRFSVKCDLCSYGLSGVTCGDERWKVSVHKAVGEQVFTATHEIHCPFFGDSLPNPPNLLLAIPVGMEGKLLSEDLFIFRRLGVVFDSSQLDKRGGLMRRSKIPTTKWDVEGFISYVLRYGECNVTSNIRLATNGDKHEVDLEEQTSHSINGVKITTLASLRTPTTSATSNVNTLPKHAMPIDNDLLETRSSGLSAGQVIGLPSTTGRAGLRSSRKRNDQNVTDSPEDSGQVFHIPPPNPSRISFTVASTGSTAITDDINDSNEANNVKETDFVPSSPVQNSILGSDYFVSPDSADTPDFRYSIESNSDLLSLNRADPLCDVVSPMIEVQARNVAALLARRCQRIVVASSSTKEIEVPKSPECTQSCRDVFSNDVATDIVTKLSPNLGKRKAEESVGLDKDISCLKYGGLLDASYFANRCIQLSHLLPHLNDSLNGLVRNLKSAQCYSAKQNQVLTSNLRDVFEELQSCERSKSVSATVSLLHDARKECDICHLLQQDVFPSQSCPHHQFCVECFIATGYCPLCPTSDGFQPNKKRARMSSTGISVELDAQMFCHYEQIVKSSAEKRLWAMMKLAHCYEDGIGVVEDFAKAVEFYILGADGGSSYAQYRLAQLYESGDGVVASKENADRWYRTAALQGHAGAKGVLAPDPKQGAHFFFNHVLYEENEYKCDHYECEMRFYQYCSEMGNPDASRYIGECFLSGIGLHEEISFPLAVKYLELAENQGDKSVEPQLWYARGMEHYYSVGVGRFVEGACQCFSEAALMGHRQGMERYLGCIIPALVTQLPINIDIDTIQSLDDIHVMKIVKHFMEQAKSQKEYLGVYFRRESQQKPLESDVIDARKHRRETTETVEERLTRIQRVFAKNYNCKK